MLKLIKINLHKTFEMSSFNKVLPREWRDNMHPANGSSTVAIIAADMRPSADESTVCTSLLTGGGKVAGSQHTYSLSSCAMTHSGATFR